MTKRNELIQFKITEVGFPNRGKAVYEDKTIKFKGGIEGQKVSARAGRSRKGTMEAKLVEVIEKSPLETEVGCPHFGICGGCTYQTLSYENEVKLKEKQIFNLFKQGGLDINFLGIESSPVVSGYRNKMEYTFGDEVKDGPLALGLHRKGRFYEIAEVTHCNIVDKDFTEILLNTLNYFQERNTTYLSKKDHKGFLRHLVIRRAYSTGEILVNLVTSSDGELEVESFLSMLHGLKLNGKITGVIHTTNDSLSDVVQADKVDILFGRDYIVEEILGLKFNISPFSFFQTNTLGAEKLYTMVREFVGNIDDKIVFDLYSGTGTIAQVMAPAAKKVIGIEIVEEAVVKARENAKLNDLHNVEFIAGDVLKAVDDLNTKPDLIVIDPPRDGIHPKAINKIIDFNPQTFIYVSCNPVTLVRDLKIFMERGYKVEKMKAMDQFPRTPHCECVVKLEKQ